MERSSDTDDKSRLHLGLALKSATGLEEVELGSSKTASILDWVVKRYATRGLVVEGGKSCASSKAGSEG